MCWELHSAISAIRVIRAIREIVVQAVTPQHAPGPVNEHRPMRHVFAALPVLLVLIGCSARQGRIDAQSSAIRPLAEATAEQHEWGTFYTYYSGQSYGTTDALAGVAVLEPGFEIHPPHKHAEEEYLTSVEGEGVWHPNGREQHADARESVYPAPTDRHCVQHDDHTQT